MLAIVFEFEQFAAATGGCVNDPLNDSFLVAMRQKKNIYIFYVKKESFPTKFVLPGKTSTFYFTQDLKER